jgi:RNA polymerase sigma factor (sigma-70 family)
METETSATSAPFPRSAIERERLVKQWTPLVRKIAGRYARRLLCWYEFSDLVSIGQVSLWRATRTHDPKGGANFGTYAYHAVYRSYEALIKHWRSLCRRGSARSDSLDEGYADGSPVRQVPNEERSSEEILSLRDDFTALECALAHLGPSERQVIRDRLVQDRSLQEIAQGRGVSRERIRQIEKRALQKLRDHLDDALPGEAPRARPPVSCRRATPRSSGSRSTRKVARPARVT